MATDIESILSILLEVKDRGIAQLNKAQSAVRQLLSAEAAAAKQSRDYARALEAQEAVRDRLIPTIKDENRAELESLKIERQLTATTQAQAASIQRLQVALAKVAAQEGRFTDALRILDEQLKRVNAGSIESLQIQSQITRVLQAQERATAKTAAEIGRQVLAEAGRARATKNTTEEIRILRGALQGNTLDTASAERATISLAKAEARLGEETRKTAAERSKKLFGRAASGDREAERQVLAQASLARASRDSRREIEILNRALESGLLTLRSREKVVLALAKAETRLAREMDAARRAAERQRRELESQRGVLDNLGRGYASFTRTLASFVLIGFTLRTFGRTIERFVVEPIRQIAEEVFTATDAFRRLQASLTGVVGAGSGVRALVSDIREASQGLPITTRQGLTGIRGLAFTPATASILSGGGADRVAGLNNLLTILSGLASIDPEQGIEGAQFAVREALAGEFRSLRFRFELSPAAIASSIGATLEELKADPQLTIRALRTFVDSFVGAEGINAFNNLMSVQGQRFRGVLDEFFNFIGDQGIYDRVTGIIRRAGDLVQGLVTTPGGQSGATRINTTLNNVLDRLLQSLSTTLTSLTGVTIDLTGDLERLDVESLATAVSNTVEGLGNLTTKIIDAIPVVAAFAAEIARNLGIDTSAEAPLTLQRRRLLDRRSALEPILQQLQSENEEIRTILRNQGFAGPGVSASVRRNAQIDDLLTGTDFADRPFGTASFFRAFERLLGSGFTVGEKEVAEAIRDLNSQIAGLDQLIQGPPTGPQGFTENVAERATSAAKALGFFEQQLNRAAEELPAFSEADTLVGNIERISRTVGEQADVLDRNLAQSVDARLSIESALAGARLENNLEAVAAHEAQLAVLLAAENSARQEFVDTFKGTIGGFLQASEGFTRQLPDIFRVRQSADILGFIAGQDLTGIPGISDILGSQRSRALGADRRSITGDTLAELQGTFSFTEDDFLDPRLGDSIANSINNIADAVARYSKDAEDGVAVTNELVDIFSNRFKAVLDDPDLSAVARENLAITIAKLEELRDAANETTSEIEKAFSQVGSSISDSLGGALTDSLIDAFETAGDNILDISQNLLRTIQAQITRLIIEFTVIRQLVNPAFNGLFGLTGANALPTIGAMGMMVSQGQVRPMAKGYVAQGPTMFGMRGNQVGLIGEEAPEVVLPVVQGPNGSLGVAASGGSGRVTNVYMNVRANDAGSFRRGARQIRSRLVEMAGG